MLLGCQLAGELVVRLTGLGIPGPVVGMLVFLAVLHWRRPREGDGLVRAPALLLSHLQLLFVPAGVGIVLYLGTLGRHALPLAAGLWASWLLGLLATALVVAGLRRLLPGRRR